MTLKISQKSYVPTEKDLEKKWYLADAKGKTLGLIAPKIANLIRGKGKNFFTRERDCGDYVVVINAKEIRLAGPKMKSKLYHWHTQFPAGLRTRTAQELMDTKPEKILEDAVWGMLPRNRLRRTFLKHLRVFPGAEHSHAAQKLQTIDL